MENKIPDNWVECRFGDVAKIHNGYAFATRDFRRDKGVPLIKQSQLNGAKVDLTKCVYLDESFLETKKDFVLKKGDVLIGMSGSVGKMCLYDLDFPALQNQRTGKAVPYSETLLIKKLFWYFLSTIERILLEKGKGLGVANVSADDIEDLVFNLPPLAEQHRIVAKLDFVMQKVESNKQRLDKIPKLLKRFRQSVLAAAVSGKLTVEWRKENINIEFPKTKQVKKKNRAVLDDKSQDYEFFELPSKWKWLTISDVADVKGGKRIPKGEKLVEHNTGLPYIKAGDIKNGIVHQNRLEYLLPATQSKIKNYIVATGDILITNVGACIGDIGIVPKELNKANQTENALKLCNHEGVYNYYLAFWLQSPIAQDFVRQTVLSAAQGKLALGRVEVFPIPLPPVEEQKEIIRRLEQLFAFADKLEARYTKAKSMMDKLPQSILAKAFRGELAAQDPNDEPASVLLERIKKEKEKLAAEKKGKKSKEYSIEERPLKIAAEGKAKYKKTKV